MKPRKNAPQSRGRIVIDALFCAALVSIATPIPSLAGINIQPTRLEIDAAHHITSLTLTNTGNEPLVFQIQTYAWAQNGGTDALTPTRDLIVAPPILTMGGGSVRIVRVALRDAEPGPRERAFRLIITQVPSKVPGSGGVQYIYQLSVPLFFAPIGAPVAKLTWSARYDAHGRRIIVSGQNTGNIHARIDQLRVFGGFGGTTLIGTLKSTADILAGASKSYAVPVKSAPIGGSVVLEFSAVNQPAMRATLDLAR